MKAVLLLATKDLRLLFRDKGGVFWTFGFPLLFAALFGAMFSGVGGGGGGRGKIHIVVVNDNSGMVGGNFIDRLGKLDSITYQMMDKVDDAKDAVRLRKATAYLVVRAPLPGSPIPEFEVGIDPSRQVESGMLRGLIFQAASPGGPGGSVAGKDMAEVVDVTREERETDRLSSSYQLTFPPAILWGIMGCVAGFAVSFVRERTRGTHLRLLIAPLSPFVSVAGKSLACLASAILVAVFLLVLGALFFGVKIDSLPLLVLAVFCIAFGFTGFMMLMGSVAKTEESVNGAGWGVLTIMAMLGGAMVPLIMFPPWLVPFSHISPVKWGIFALEGAIWRGFSFGEMLTPLGILVGLGVVCFGLAMRLQQKARI